MERPTQQDSLTSDSSTSWIPAFAGMTVTRGGDDSGGGAGGSASAGSVQSRAESRSNTRKPVLIPLLMAAILLAGCNEDWEKKFIRHREKPPQPAQFEVEQIHRPYPELYKEHFNYWRNWHGQLLQDLGRNHKRELRDLREANRQLESLEKYLTEPKKVLVRHFLEELDQGTLAFERISVSPSDYGIMKQRLESLQLEVERNLHPKKVKDYFLPTPLPMNLAEYEGEEPKIPAPVKTGVLKADRDKDEGKPISYEEYRGLPHS